VISSIIDQWIKMHAQAPPSPPPEAPSPVAGEVLGQALAEGAAAPYETRTMSQAVPPALKVTPQQQRVLDAVPLATTAPEGFSRKDIMQVTGLSEQAVDSALFKLNQRGHISRVAKGQYVRSA
jgi:predicted Rossmann fold nucleotide-binding protein DprA/Smf involved in DNA uptake